MYAIKENTTNDDLEKKGGEVGDEEKQTGEDET